MAQQDRTVLKGYFNTGDTPTEAQFADLIDSFPNTSDDGTVATLAGAETLTNKTLTAPVLGGTVTGTFTIGGTPTLAASIAFDADGTRNIGDATNRAGTVFTDAINLNGTTLDGTTLADPGADRILFWDDSAGTTAYLTASTGLAISTTNLAVTGVLEDLVTLGANSADGEFLVGTGAGALAWESGATARTSLGAAALGANVFTGTQDFNAQQVEGFANKVVTSVTGALTMADHSGNILKTSGNITVPTTAGFNAVIIAGGAHTVTFNSTTSAAMATGDVMTVVVESGTVIHAVLTAAADKVSFT